VEPALLDTDVLSLYLRQGDAAIVDHIEGLTVADRSESESSGGAS
jgi:hypothetical protein